MTCTTGHISITEVHRVRQTSHYIPLPNDLARGRGVYAGLDLLERGMLTALLSMDSGWTTSRRGIEQLAPGLGRDTVSRILRRLRELGFLSIRRISTGAHGFRWAWIVSMLPMSTGSRDHVDCGDVDGDDQPTNDETPGQPIDVHTVTGDPSTLEVPGCERPKNHLPVDEPGPSQRGEGVSRPNHSDQVAEIHTHQPGWRPSAIAAVIAKAVGQGRDATIAVTALLALAKGTYGHTYSPRRLLADGPWWSPAPTPTPRPRSKSCPDHPGQLAATCSACAGERHHPVSLVSPSTSVMTSQTARRLAADHAAAASAAAARIRAGRLATMAA